MLDLSLKPLEGPAWTSLGKDVEGLCSICQHKRTLEIQHIPTNAWICRRCFADYWREADRPAQ